MNQTERPILLNIPEACARLGIRRTKLYELIKDRKLPARKLGRRTLIAAVDVELFVESLPQARP